MHDREFAFEKISAQYQTNKITFETIGKTL